MDKSLELRTLNTAQPDPVHRVLRFIGSLWFAAVLLVMALVAMACGTVYETMYNAERARADFYQSVWFEAILALIAINALASIIVRYPFSRRQIGFLLTHAGILITLGGAWVTGYYGIDGQVGLFEGETTDALNAPGNTLTVVNRQDQSRASVDLTSRAFGEFHPVERPDAPTLTLGDLRIDVRRFLPDGEWVQQIVDDNPGVQPAVEVSLSASGHDEPVWLFAGRTDSVDGIDAEFRVANSDEELTKLMAPPSDGEAETPGVVKVEYEGRSFEIPLPVAQAGPVPLGDTGVTIRVLRYLPHAVVGGESGITNASDRAVNPAIEAEIVGPAGTEKRLAFARFPDFGSMHGKQEIEGLKLTFVAPSEAASEVPLEIISGPTGTMYVRFNPEGGQAVVHKVEAGVPVQTPWPDRQFSVLRRFEHARSEWTMEPVENVREDRTPALLLELRTPEHSRQMWVQKYGSRPVTVDGNQYELSYSNRRVPLGFSITLDHFHIGYYPGGMRPRSFESHVTITDPTTGRTRSQVISMNHPVKHAGYTFYQSSYREGPQRTASFLSVSRDPGQPIVFAGYIIVLAGMVVVLGIRMADRRKAERPTRVTGLA